MAGLPPGDPQLVSMIVNHLKTQGLFDQFRRDCLADVDTKPAYLNLKQRVDNFVSNHLSNHTWSPHLNKNQLRNNIRQLVLQSGMLEQGVDRIVTQVVDPKINHIFRPQVERVVREFLLPGSCSQEMPTPLPPAEIKSDSSIPEQASLSTPTTTAASDAMSILDTITSLNQEASVRASSATEKGPKGQTTDDLVQLVEENVQDMNIVDEGDGSQDGKPLDETEETKGTVEVQASEVKTEHTQEQMELDKEGLMDEIKMEEEELGTQEQTEEEKDRRTSKISGKPSEEKHDDDDALKSTSQAKQKARERIKEEYSLEDSDLEGLSDITVSSVHTSDLSSFEEESDEEEQLSDSSEEGELPPDDQTERAEKKPTSGDTGDDDKESKPRRKAYVHKPFLYSRYYSDSDDEITVEERRRSAAKEKEERLFKRSQNRERMEEKRKQKASQTQEQDHQQQKIPDSASLECPKAKEARKERKVLEKKMALNRKRKLDSRKEVEVSSKKKGNTGDTTKKAEVKPSSSKTPQPKLMRNLSESASSDEKHRRMSGSISEDSSDTKKLSEKSRTHSFILDLEQGSHEALKQRSFGKFDRLSRKELHSKERKDKERSLSDERAKLKQKQEKKSEHQLDESQMKEGTAVKGFSEEKGEKKPKIKSEKKMAASTKEGKMAEGVPDEGGFKDAKKTKGVSGETVKAEKEKDKIREKDKIKEKEKAKAEKSTFKSDFKQLLRPDSAGSSEDRSDMEPGSDSTKKREKKFKDVLKRSKSHTEDKSGDKPKSKTDSEKDKTKADQDSQKLQKSSSETDKDSKRLKTTEKGKIAEKPKVKSKEEAKIPLLLKTVKKVQSSDVKSAGGTGIIKPEATKDKKKDGNAKEQRRVTGESSHDKSDLKSSKKKLEKKDKVPERKDDSQEEKTIKEEKLEKSDKFSKSSSVSLILETEESLKKQPLLQETSTDSDPVTTTVTTSFSDDTCDALSDITPEPPEGETESRLGEVPAIPAGNDALLTLMDVCTSAEARLPPECLREEATPKTELQDADMKMKEAALTLLSMDPDSTMSSSLICQDTRDEEPLYPPDTKQVEATSAEEVVLLPVQVQQTNESELSASETSPACHQAVELKPDTADESDNSGGKMDTSETEMTEMVAPLIKVDDAASNTYQISSKEEETKSVETPPETQLYDKMAVTEDQEVIGAVESALEEARGSTEVSTASFSDTTEQVSEIPSKPEQTEPDFEVRTTNPRALEAEEEENQTKMVVDKGEAESKIAGENVPAEEGDLQTMETIIPNTSEEGEAESVSKLVKQISNVSSTDSQEDEKSSDLSEKEEKKDGRGRRKRKLSCQKGDKKDEKEGKEQLSAEENEKDKVVEVGTTRRGRPSRSTEEAEKDPPTEAEKSEEPPSRRGRRSGAAAKEAAADNQKEDENRAEDIAHETSPMKEAVKEEKGEDEGKPEQIVPSGVEGNLPSSAPEDSEGAGSSDFQETTDTRKPMKRNGSEVMEESSEETQAQEEMKENRGQEQSTEQCEKDSGEEKNVCSPSASQSEDVKEEVCSDNTPDHAEEEKQEEQKEDQEVTLKKPARRGRPPKAAATEDSDKKDKKPDEKGSEQNDEEEEEEGEKEGDDKDSATRATTRLASRLEAEKNKPSKPSTRASRQSGKEETTAGTRGTRGQAASKGVRKREASPPAARMRGGQKSEEPPSKRGKR